MIVIYGAERSFSASQIVPSHRRNIYLHSVRMREPSQRGRGLC
jgi:hypothetical protein